MKRTIFIWMLCLGGLLFGQEAMAQRHGSGDGHRRNGQVFKKNAQKNYRKGKKAVYHQQGHYKNRGKHKGHYNRIAAPYYHQRNRVVRRPARRPAFRPAPWAARRHYNYNRHVYFPDYHAFYDARRHGYVYRHANRWIFSQAVPSFMVGVNWNNVRIQYLQGVALSAYPQAYYNTYASRYPAVAFNLNLNL